MVRMLRLGFRVFGAALVATALLTAPHQANAFGYPWLTAQQLSQLRALRIPVLIPAYVPRSFRLVRFVVVHDGEASRYELWFRAVDGRQLVMSIADGGQLEAPDIGGDSGPDYESFRRPFTVDSPVIGPTKFVPAYHPNAETHNNDIWLSSRMPLRRVGNKKAWLWLWGTTKADVKPVYASLELLRR